MTDKNQMSAIPTEMPPEAPPELQAKRQAIIDGLEAAAKTATGALQGVLRVMAQVLHACRPGSSLELGAEQGMREAMKRYEPEAAKNPWPEVLEEAVAWMQDYLTARGFGLADNSYPPRAGDKETKAPAGMDMFERIAGNKPSLTGETPIAPKAADGEGGLKNWQLNPSIGKMRG